MKIKKFNTYIYILVAVLISVSLLQDSLLSAQTTSESIQTIHEYENTNSEDEREFVSVEIAMPYLEYLKLYDTEQKPLKEIKIDSENFKESSYEPVIYDNYAGVEGSSLLTEDFGYVEWEFSVEIPGLYNLMIEYFPYEGKSSSILREIQINGELPFAEARNITFYRVWEDKRDENNVAIQRDSRGNDIRPSQIESPFWMKIPVRDTSGFANEPLSFYLEKGANTIRLNSRREPMLIRSLTFYNEPPIPTYSDVKKEYDAKGYKKAEADPIKIQAQDARYKSDAVIVPVFDRSSPLTEPNHHALLRLNSIGGFNWQKNGQWITWDFKIDEPGLYTIALRERQNIINGAFSSRRIYINDKVLFQELNQVVFNFDPQWRLGRLGSQDEPYQFYFDEGTHEIKMEVTLGIMSDILSEVNDITIKLNSIYRSILVVTGTVPDLERDYEFNVIMPDVIEDLRVQSERLLVQYEKIINLTQMRGENAQILNRLYMQTKEMSERPHTIPRRFTAFENNISSLGTWVMNTQNQPMTLDYIYISPIDSELPPARATVWQNIVFHTKSFFASFIYDYSSISDDGDEDALTVWVGSGLTGGRDQAQILKSLADNTFTPDSKISVNLQLVIMGSLLPATLAGIGPDIALTLGQGDPVNYAIRNAAVDLSAFPDYAEIETRFNESAILPLRFNGGVYGLPETQTFPMLFYRKDILQELNLPIPQTWNDVIVMLPVLQKRQMHFVLPPAAGAGGFSMPAYSIILFQNGGSYYSEDLTKSMLDSPVAIDSFAFLTSLYNDYKIPVVVDFANRFRTGSTPIGIADYSFFNQLSVFAPELEGLWGFTHLPGVQMEDGTIDRSAAGVINACIILQNTQNHYNSWEFLKWWTEAETQVMFGREIESILGTAARYPTANLEAFYRIPWSTDNFESLMKQSKWVRGIPEVPGGYFTPRHLDFAFRDVINNGYEPGERISKSARAITNEITVKRREFGLTD